MKSIDVRKIRVLKLIVEEYLTTGELTGSKSLLAKHDLDVSPATVRNDMSSLEKMGLVYQPYNSAGRLPTPRGIRVFVDYLVARESTIFIEAEQRLQQRIHDQRIDDLLYDLVSRLMRTTGEISFACIPTLGTNYYLGIADFLRKHSILLGDEQAYRVIKVLEDKHKFLELITDLEITEKVAVFIGEENILPDMESCAMIIKKTQIEGHTVFIGVLGSLRMDYAFAIQALRGIL